MGFHKIMTNRGEGRRVVEIKISTMHIIVAIFEYSIALLGNEKKYLHGLQQIFLLNK